MAFPRTVSSASVLGYDFNSGASINYRADTKPYHAAYSGTDYVWLVAYDSTNHNFEMWRAAASGLDTGTFSEQDGTNAPACVDTTNGTRSYSTCFDGRYINLVWRDEPANNHYSIQFARFDTQNNTWSSVIRPDEDSSTAISDTGDAYLSGVDIDTDGTNLVVAYNISAIGSMHGDGPFCEYARVAISGAMTVGNWTVGQPIGNGNTAVEGRNTPSVAYDGAEWIFVTSSQGLTPVRYHETNVATLGNGGTEATLEDTNVDSFNPVSHRVEYMYTTGTTNRVLSAYSDTGSNILTNEVDDGTGDTTHQDTGENATAQDCAFDITSAVNTADGGANQSIDDVAYMVVLNSAGNIVYRTSTNAGAWSSATTIVSSAGDRADSVLNANIFVRDSNYRLAVVWDNATSIQYTEVDLGAAAAGNVSVTVPAASLSLTGQTPTVEYGPLSVTVPAASMSLTGQVPTVTAPVSVTVPVASLSLTGQVPTVEKGPLSITVPQASLSLTGQVPTAEYGPLSVTVPQASLTLTGQAPTVSAPNVVTVPTPGGGAGISQVGTTQSTWNANGNNVTLTFDGSPQEGDICIVFGGIGEADGAYTPLPTGYTQIATTNTNSRIGIAYKVMGATPDTNVTFPGSGDGTNAVAAAAFMLRGVHPSQIEDVAEQIASGTIDGGTGGYPNSPQLTTLTDGSWVFSCFIMDNPSAPDSGPAGYSGFTSVNATDTVNAKMGVAYLVKGTAGAEDPGQFAATAWSGDTTSWDAVTIAIKPEPATSLVLTGYAPTVTAPETVTVPTASLTLTGQVPTVDEGAGVTVEVPTASLSLAGQVPTVSQPNSITVPVATLTLAGQAPTVEYGPLSITVPVASLTLAGQVPTAEYGPLSVTVPVASLTLAGQTPTVSAPYALTVPTASLTLAGQTPTVDAPESVTVPTASLTLTAQTPTVSAPYSLTVPTASLTLSGQTPTVEYGPLSVTVPQASLTLTGYAPDIQSGGNINITVPTASLSLAGQIPVAEYGPLSITVGAASLTLTGQVPVVTEGANVSVTVPTASLSLSAQTPTAEYGPLSITVPAASLSLAGQVPTVDEGANVSVTVPQASLSLTAQTPTVAYGPLSVTVPQASLTLTGYAPDIQAGGNISVTVPAASLTLAGQTPTVTAPVSLTVPTASLTLSGQTPTVSAPYSLTVPTASLTLTGYAPDIQTGNDIDITVPTASLSITGQQPTAIAPYTLIVPSAALTLSAGTPLLDFAFLVPSAGLTLTGQTPSVLEVFRIIVPTASLTLTGQTPSAIAPYTVVVPSASLTLTPYAPSQSAPSFADEADVSGIWGEVRVYPRISGTVVPYPGIGGTVEFI